MSPRGAIRACDGVVIASVVVPTVPAIVGAVVRNGRVQGGYRQGREHASAFEADASGSGQELVVFDSRPFEGGFFPQAAR